MAVQNDRVCLWFSTQQAGGEDWLSTGHSLLVLLKFDCFGGLCRKVVFHLQQFLLQPRKMSIVDRSHTDSDAVESILVLSG